MLEITLCSLLTILPDYLIRRFLQGKKITFFSVWYELRWGITGCLILTTLLITTIFYFHPATTSATSAFRTVPVLPETIGRVSEIYVNSREVSVREIRRFAAEHFGPYAGYAQEYIYYFARTHGLDLE